MPLSPDFWAPRDSFLSPIPEIALVADILEKAADAILQDDRNMARELIVRCDLPELRSYRSQIVEGPKEHIHRLRKVPEAPPHFKKADRITQRMPSKKTQLAIFRRDGWRCRFCGIRIISLDAIRFMDSLFPDEVRWRQTPYSKRNVAFNVLASSLDHVLPHERGGTNEPDNLVAACGSCQFGRMEYTLEEVGLTDPRSRTPIRDKWDGLERLCRIPRAPIPER